MDEELTEATESAEEAEEDVIAEAAESLKPENQTHGRRKKDPTRVPEADKGAERAARKQELSKRKYLGPTGFDDSDDSLKENVNYKFLRNALASVNLPPIDISDEKQVEKRVGEYFAWCLEEDKMPQKVELANWLGVSMQTIGSWASSTNGRRLEHQKIIQKAESIMHSLWYDMMQTGAINPVTGIFLGKNVFGYRDTTDVSISSGPLSDEPNQKELEAKLADLVVDGEVVQPKALPDGVEDAEDAESVETSIFIRRNTKRP